MQPTLLTTHTQVLNANEIIAQLSSTIVHVVLGVIIVLIFVIVIRNIRKTKEYMDNCKAKIEEQNARFSEEIETRNQSFMRDVIRTITMQQEKMLMNVMNHKHTNKNLANTFIKLRGALMHNCMETMQEISASRIAIYLFHNGTRSTHGLDFFKMSCICEEIKPGTGIREKLIEHSNIQINLFDNMIDKLITNGKYIIMNDEEQQLSGHRMFLSSKAVTYTQLVAIFDSGNNILGFVCAEMTHEYNRETVIKEKQDLDELIVQIVPVLSYSEYIDTTIDETTEKQNAFQASGTH
jgi:hypothetical protein